MALKMMVVEARTGRNPSIAVLSTFSSIFAKWASDNNLSTEQLEGAIGLRSLASSMFREVISLRLNTMLI